MFPTIYIVVLTSESPNKVLKCDHAVVLFTILYKVVLTFESVDEILKCDHSNENY